jgi:hypothetical protein
MGHSTLSRAYANKTEFHAATLKYLADKVLTEPLKTYVVNVVGGGDEDTAAVKMKADTVCRNGEWVLSAFMPFFLMTCVLGREEFELHACFSLLRLIFLRTGEQKLIRVE